MVANTFQDDELELRTDERLVIGRKARRGERVRDRECKRNQRTLGHGNNLFAMLVFPIVLAKG
jgi:hypothetical protein